MSRTTVSIKGKQCGPNSEISDEIANKLYATKGTKVLAIVEIKSETTHEALDGDRKVDCAILSFEPVIDGNLNGALDEHVRTIQAALARNRALATGDDDTLFEDDGPAPAVADIIQQGQPFVVDEDDDDLDDDTEDDDVESDADEDVESDADEADAPTPITVPNPFASVPS